MFSLARNVLRRNTQPSSQTLRRITQIGSTRYFSNTLSCLVQSDEKPAESKSYRNIVTAYYIAQQYNMERVNEIIAAHGIQAESPKVLQSSKKGRFAHVKLEFDSGRLPYEDGWKADSTGDVFVFPTGTIVSWGVPRADIIHLASNLLDPAAKDTFEKVTKDVSLAFEEDPWRWRNNNHIDGKKIVLGTRIHRDPHEAKRLSTQARLTKIAYSSALSKAARITVMEELVPSPSQVSQHVLSRLDHGFVSDLRSGRWAFMESRLLLQFQVLLSSYTKLADDLPGHGADLEKEYKKVEELLDIPQRMESLKQNLDDSRQIYNNVLHLSSELRSKLMDMLLFIFMTSPAIARGLFI